MARVRLKTGLKVDASDTMPASNALTICKTGGEIIAESTIRTEGFNIPGITIATPVLSVTEGDTFELAAWVGTSFAISPTASFLGIEVVEAVGLTTTLADLADTDVTTTPLEDGATLVWDDGGAKWVPRRSPHNARVFVTLPGAQAVPANTGTTLVFSSVSFDTGGDLDPVTHRFTAPALGLYLAVIGFTDQDTSSRPRHRARMKSMNSRTLLSCSRRWG